MSQESNHQTRRRQTQEYQEDFPPLPSTWRAQRRGYRSRLLTGASGRRQPSSGPNRGRIPPPPERRYGRIFGDTDREPWNLQLDHWDRSLDQLEENHTHIQALLDLTRRSHLGLPPLPSMSSSMRSLENPEDNRRAKRRKLDSERLAAKFESLRYGKYGQVEPGPLTLEIASCDGGIYSNESSYAAENILRDDGTVYCTKGDRCNIVLRHQGGAAFSLTELVIKAPGSNFSSPVREGMVFVAMNSDDLLNRTAEYQIPYLPARYHSAYSRGSAGPSRVASDLTRDNSLLVRYNLDLGEVETNRPVISIRHNDDGSTVATTHSRRSRRFYDTSPDNDDEDQSMAEMPSEFKSILPSFHITIECSDEVDENTSPPMGRRPPNRIGPLPFESDSSDESDPLDIYDFDDDVQRRGGARPSRAGVSREPGSSSTAPTAQGRAAAAGSGGNLMTPHAKFFIEKDKSKCTLRFDPPVSGRFILLKMWSSHLDPSSNIDIQGVVARGFAGPRFFPAVQMR